jgi:hypothetical protein
MKLILLAGVLFLNHLVNHIQIATGKSKQYYQVSFTSGITGKQVIISVDLDGTEFLLNTKLHSFINSANKPGKTTASKFYPVGTDSWIMFSPFL